MILPKFEYHHYTNANTTDAYFSEQVLGFFNFDDSNFCAINEQVLREVKEHLQNGRRIEITAMTDGFGTTAYNANLAQQRANTAVGIIDSSYEYKSLISIGQQQTSTDTNATPYQQQRRRVVIVRFMK
jgi:outer membrane protein OmpA-like peptidoglycan-associated protein